MPYCVNCGVQLNEKAKECPLCHTEVIIRNYKHLQYSERSTNLEKEMVKDDFDRGLWIKLMSITLLTPATLSILVNWIFQKSISWSLYVSSSVIFVWIWAISPFFFRKKNRFLKWIPLGWSSLLIFLYFIEWVSKFKGWFFPIGIPIVTSFFSILAILTVLITKKRIRELQIPSSILLGIGLFCFCINGAINLYNHQVFRLDWSLIVMTTCIAFGLIGIVLQQRPWIVEKLKHWFRI